MREWPRTEGVFIALGGPQAHRSAALTFVISTEAQRSGEISVLTRLPGNVFRPERTRISCYAALDKTACAPSFKERRMMFANVTNFYRKCGVA
jgi:hypothetical protein